MGQAFIEKVVGKLTRVIMESRLYPILQ